MVGHATGATKMPQVPSGKMLRPSIAVEPVNSVCLRDGFIGRLEFIHPLRSGLLVLTQNSSYFGLVNGCRARKTAGAVAAGRTVKYRWKPPVLRDV